MRINVFDKNLHNFCANSSNNSNGLRFSKFVFIFQKNGFVALYHSLTHQTIFIPVDVYLKLDKAIRKKQNVRKEGIKVIIEMIRQGFLVSSNYNEEEIIQEIRLKFLGKPCFRIMYLLLADGCNLDCRYCFIKSPISQRINFTLMDAKTAIKSIEFFARLLVLNPKDRRFKNPPTILFYGGEPLLNVPVFISSVKKIRESKENGKLPSDAVIILLTNATLLTDEVIDIISENNVRVSVSLDGPKKFHDANRIFVNQEGTFDIVRENIYRLKKAGIEISISCTITNESVEQLDTIFEWIISEFDIRSLGFNILLDVPGKVKTSEEYIMRATKRIITCYEIGRQKGIYEDRIMRKVKAFTLQYLHINDCGGCGNQIVVAPDGRIGPCQAYLTSRKFFSGSIHDDSFDPFTDNVFIEWSKRSPFNMEGCLYCEAIGLCGGGCCYNAEVKKGNIWQVDSNFCIHSKMILEWLIWDLFERTREKRKEKKQ